MSELGNTPRQNSFPAKHNQTKSDSPSNAPEVPTFSTVRGKHVQPSSHSLADSDASQEFTFLEMEDVIDEGLQSPLDELHTTTTTGTRVSVVNEDDDDTARWFIQLGFEQARRDTVEGWILDFDTLLLYGVFDTIYKELAPQYTTKSDLLFYGAKEVQKMFNDEEQDEWVEYIRREHPELAD